MTLPQAGALSLSKRRVDDGEVRQRMIKVAADFIRDEGLTVSLDHLNYELIIQAAAVPRSAAYRLWKKKEDFFADLLQDVAASRWQGSAMFSEEVVAKALDAALVFRDELDSSEGRKRALLNAARVGIQYEYESLIKSTEWQTYVALLATIMSLPDGALKSTLIDNIRNAESSHVEKAAEFYSIFSRLVGFRIRQEFDGNFEVMASVVAAIVEGFALRSIVAPPMHSRQYIMDAFGLGLNVDWSLTAFACISALEPLVEEDPDYRPTPDLLSIVQSVITDALDS